jgi:sec-independent protein translocase protein TatA
MFCYLCNGVLNKNKLIPMLSIILKPVLLLSMPGESEWLLILLVILLFFGGKKIPDLMRGIGKGVREFNDAKEHVKSEIEAGMKEKDIVPEPPKAPVTAAQITTSTSATTTE